MERLTVKLDDGYAYCKKRFEEGQCEIPCEYCSQEDKVYEKLAQYEDLEEQGLLLKLPFPLGTKRLYWIDMSEEDKEVYQLDATDLNIQKTDISDTIIYTIDDYDFVKSDFGKTVFLTKEEAEKKLAEMTE